MTQPKLRTETGCVIPEPDDTPVFLQDAQFRLRATRVRLEYQARQCRNLAASADGPFKAQYLELADGIEAYLQTTKPLFNDEPLT